ncbi:MAG TPA: bifunctional oligoribonuclease/PAP phosphatase NrnA [Chloroflexota bacterium]|nr:bifunctional oligoribonuclease/PAP phosphatase NrnA [Chloroflexota bacterium]
MNEWDGAAGLLRGAERILVCSHRKPDGDAIGSLLGLGRALEGLGKQVTLACADAPENNLAKLPGAGTIVQDLAPLYAADRPLPWDLGVVVDASSLDRLGTLYETNKDLFAALPLLDVDHHVTNAHFGEVSLVDPSAASTTEVLTLLLEQMGVVPTGEAATCLLAGLMTDSLSFQTESTTPRTLRVAASLVEAGASLSGLAFQLFRQRPRASALLWSRALGTLQFAAEGRIAWLEVTREMVESAGAGADSGGLSGFAGSIEGVMVGFQIEEGADGNVYVGFRSQTVDVAALAAEFGGGGHMRAAGCNFKAPATIADARAALLPVVERHLRPPRPDASG